MSFKQTLDKKFTIKDLGLAKYFLGIELCRTKDGVHLNQRKYILDLLQDAVSSSLPQHLKLALHKGTLITSPDSNRRLVGRLLYLSMTRPDISYDVQHLSQFVSLPREPHMQAALHVLRYLKGTVSKGLFYHVQPQLKVTGFSYADWASCIMTRRSLTGNTYLFGSFFSFLEDKEASYNV